MKKNIPLVVLEKLQPFTDKYKEVIKAIPSSEIFFKLIDKDQNSDCYFQVVRQEASNGRAGYIIEHKPASNTDAEMNRQWTNLESLVAHAENWKNLIVAYNGIQTVHDDPVLKQYEDEFSEDFKIVDIDASTARFNFSQQLLLLEYIDNMANYIANDESEFSQEDKKELIDIAEALKPNIATETKENVIKRFSGFWAKVRKKSIKACEFAVKEFAKEFIKEMIKKGMTVDWAALPEYIESIKLIGH